MLKKLLILFNFLPFFLSAQDLHLVRNGQGKYGFADSNNDTVIECKYEYAENFSSGLALVKNNLRYNVIDTSGQLWELSEFDGSKKFRYDLGEFHTGLPILVEKWDCAYINSSGDIYLSLPYSNAKSFKNGKAEVFDGQKYNYISKKGILLGNWHEQEDDYHAIKYNGKFGYINKNAKLVIDYQFVEAKDFKNGLGQISNGTYWAIIDKNGERLSDWYEKIGDFKENLAIVHKLGNIGFINKQGKFMGQWYKGIEPLQYGLFKVSKYDKYALVNREGYLVSQWFDEIDDFEHGYLKVMKEGKYAFVNKIGAMVVGWYDNLGNIENGIVRVVDNGRYAFYNVEEFYISPFFDTLGTFRDGWAIIKKEGKYTYIDKKGNKLSDFIYDYCSDFDNNIAQVVKDNKTAYIDRSGKIILGWFDVKKYIEKTPPKGIVVVKYGNYYGYESLNGKRLIPARYSYAENFVDGLALVKNNPREMYVTKEGKLVPKTSKIDKSNLRLDLGYGHSGEPIVKTKWDCAFIDYSGDIVFKLDDYDDAHSFDGGKAMVIKGDKYNFINPKGKIIGNWKEFPDQFHADVKNGKFGFINKNGEKVIDYKFDYAEDFYGNKALVRYGSRKTGKYAYINRKGENITKLYDFIGKFKNNIALVKNNNKYAIMDTSGTELSKSYDFIYPFKEGLARVKDGSKYSFINRKGQQITSWFDEAADFSNSRAKVKIGEKWGFIDKTGSIVVQPQYDVVWNYSNNMAKVQKDGKYAFIDLNGRYITEWFDRLYMFSEGRAVFVKDRKWGYLDIDGKIVIKPIYDRAFAFSNGYALVYKEGKMYKIDYQGNIVK